MHTWQQYSGGPGSGVYITHDGGATWTKVESGHAEVARRQDRRRDRAVGLEADVRADSDRRSGIALAIRRRRRGVERRELGSVADRPRRLLHPHRRQPAECRRRAGREQQLPSIERRRHDVSRVGGGCGDCHDIWIDPKDAEPLRADRRRRRDHDRSRRRTTRACACRSGRCITSPSTTSAVLDLQQPAGRRHDARAEHESPEQTRQRPAAATAAAAAPAAAAAGRGGRGARRRRWRRRRSRRRRRRTGLGAEHRRLRVRLHDARSRPTPTSSGRSCYGNKLTRWDARARARRDRSAPWIITLDSAPNLVEVPLPLDAAARDRSVRSQHGLLRLPGDLQDVQRRPDAGRDQPGSLDAGSEHHRSVRRHRRRQPRPVLRRARVRDRAVADAAGPDLGRHERRQGLEHAQRRRQLERRDEEHHGHAAVGARRRKIEPSHFDAGTAYVAVDYHLVDNRDPFIYKTTDFGATWTNVSGDLPATHPLDYVLSVAENPNKKGMLFAGTGHGVLLLAGRRRALDAVQGRPAGRAGDLDRRRAALPRRRRLDLRTRPVHPARHHACSSRPAQPTAAGADGTRALHSRGPASGRRAADGASSSTRSRRRRRRRCRSRSSTRPGR